jgi:hypothetical protein
LVFKAKHSLESDGQPPVELKVWRSIFRRQSDCSQAVKFRNKGGEARKKERQARVGRN